MNKRIGAALVACLVAAIGCSGDGHEADRDHAESAARPPAATTASAVIEPKSGSSLSGRAEFSSTGEVVTLTLRVSDAPPGAHAVHLHEFGDCSSDDGKSAGGHWNPTRDDHGRWGESPFHLGDIGNMTVVDDGTGEITLASSVWSIGTGEDDDILGRAIIVHAEADDFTSQPTGGAGGRIGCGVVGPGS